MPCAPLSAFLFFCFSFAVFSTHLRGTENLHKYLSVFCILLGPTTHRKDHFSLTPTKEAHYCCNTYQGNKQRSRRLPACSADQYSSWSSYRWVRRTRFSRRAESTDRISTVSRHRHCLLEAQLSKGVVIVYLGTMLQRLTEVFLVCREVTTTNILYIDAQIQ